MFGTVSPGIKCTGVIRYWRWGRVEPLLCSVLLSQPHLCPRDQALGRRRSQTWFVEMGAEGIVGQDVIKGAISHFSFLILTAPQARWIFSCWQRVFGRESRLKIKTALPCPLCPLPGDSKKPSTPTSFHVPFTAKGTFYITKCGVLVTFW